MAAIRTVAPEAETLGLVVPLVEDDPGALEPLIESLRSQYSDSWKLVVVAASPVAAEKWINERLSSANVRVTSAGSSFAESLNAGAEKAACEFVAFLAPGDALAPDAVAHIVEAFRAAATPDLVYADEFAADGAEAVLKPAFSPERLRCQNYLGALVAYRASSLHALGGADPRFPGAELYDLSLRVTASSSRAARIEHALVKPGPAPLAAVDPPNRESAVRAAVQVYLDATGGGKVLSIENGGVFDTRRPVVGDPLVSIVIPTRGDSATIRGTERCLVVDAVRSVLYRSTYTNFEFVIILDDSTPAAARDELRALGGDRLRFVEWSAPFSFSGKMNLGVVHARGEYVLFLNDDIEVISEGWIEAMLALAQRPKAGIVGAMLYFEDETIQHAGHAYYRSDVTHIGLGSERGSRGPDGAFLVEREVDGVTAACAIMSRELFFLAGGFSPLLPGNFNDVDLCMKVAALGYQSYWTPHAELYHYESKTRDPRVALYEITTTWGRWEPGFWESKFWPEDPHTLYRA